jgi:hypothetical protein
MTRRTSGDVIDDLVRQGKGAFRAAMHGATDEALWRLHAALEKATFTVVRGSWGTAPTEAGVRSLRATACPLTALVVGEPKAETDMQLAQVLIEMRLQRFGYRASDFYDVWDRGLISHRRLLKIVDEETTHRALHPRRKGSAGRSSTSRT